MHVAPLPGDEFLATWVGRDWVARRIRGSDGAVLESLPDAGRFAWRTLAATDTTVLVVEYQAPHRVQLLDAEDLTPIGPVGSLPQLDNVEPTLVVGEGQYLITWPGYAARVDETTGLLDPEPIVVSKYSQGPMSGAFVAGNYHLAWRSSYDGAVLGVRIRASDGLVLDPDDDFNERTGARVLCGPTCSPYQDPYDLSVHAVGSKVLTTWRDGWDSAYYLRGALFDGVTGQREGSAATEVGGTLASVEHRPGPRHFDATGGTLLADNLMKSITLEAAPLSGTLGLQHFMAMYIPPRASPAVAVAGTTFLTAWTEDNYVVYARRLDGSGELLDDDPIALDITGRVLEGNEVVAASNGNDFLVAWSSYYYVDRRMVYADGTLGPLLPRIRGNDDDFTNLGLVNNGDYFYLTYGNNNVTYGLRMLNDGTALGDPVTLAANDERHLTLADTIPTSDRRTFLSLSGFGTVRRLRAQSGVLLDATSLECNSNTAAATDGGRMFSLCGLSGFFIDPVTGLQVEGSVRDDLLPPLVTSFGATKTAWWDGRSFAAIVGRNGGSLTERLTIRRFDRDLAVLDGQVGGAGHFVGVAHSFDSDVAVVGKEGHSLLVHQAYDPNKFGIVLKGHFITNDGLPAPASPGDLDPERGEGGASGSSGNETGGAPGVGGSPGAGGQTHPGAGGVGGDAVGGGRASGGAPDGEAGVAGVANGEAGSGGSSASAGDGGSAGGGAPAEGGAPGAGGKDGGEAGSPAVAAGGTGPGSAGRGGSGGQPATTDAGAGGASEGDDSGGESPDEGCGCSLPGRGSADSRVLALFVVMVAAVRRRRRAYGCTPMT
jgi:hypothetical protein